jgi:hypothetical protein
MAVKFVCAGRLDPWDLLKPLVAVPKAEFKDPSAGVDENTEEPSESSDEAVAEHVGRLSLEPTEEPTTLTKQVPVPVPAMLEEPEDTQLTAVTPAPVAENISMEADPTDAAPIEEMQAPMETENSGFIMDLEGDAGIHVPKKLQKAPIVRAPSPVDENPGFFMDLDGDAEVHVPKKLQKPPVVRQPSPANSISSDGSEKIVFVPRSDRGRPPPTPKTQTSNASTNLNAPITPKSMPPTPKPVVTSTIVQSRTVTTSVTVSGPPTKAKEVSPADNYIQLNSQTGFNGQRATPGSKRRKSKGKGKAPASSKSADQEAYDDYVENVAATMRAEAKDDPYNELLKDPIFAAPRKRDLGDDDGNDAWTDESGDEDDEAEDDAAIEAYKNGWDSDHIRALQDQSTDEDEPRGLVSKILLRRKRCVGGIQYLVKWDGYDTDDARWVYKKHLDSSADVKIKRFEEKRSKNQKEQDDAYKAYKKAWDAENLRQLEDLSTDYEGSKGLVSRILLKRKRPSGLQYLIKWDGYDTDDASWIHEDNLDSSADVKVRRFEKKLLRIQAEGPSIEDSDSEDTDYNMDNTKDSDEEEDCEEDSEDDDEDDDEDDEGDTEDNDRKLAIVLQMQEDGVMAVDNYTELEELSDDFFPMGVGKKSKKQKKAKKSLLHIEADPYTGRYPNASKMAAQFDELDEFDVMDWERPSLTMGKKKKKGKGYQGDLEGIDPELREQIGNAWDKDRAAKKRRKIEREELRAQGLLGVKAQKTGKADLKEKYARGMTMTQVFDEIRQFMLRDHSRYLFPRFCSFLSPQGIISSTIANITTACHSRQ